MPTATEKASASLGGKRLILTSPVMWRLTEGVQPSINMFDISPDDAEAVFTKGGPLTLEINPVEGNPVVVTNLWVLNINPGPNPWISRIVVADRRWFFTYGHILLRMNMRRNVGVKRILANDKFAVTFDRAFDVAFAKYSLDPQNNKRFVALRMVQLLLQKISQIEKDYNGTTFSAKIDERIGSRIRGLPLEDLEIDDTGDAALRRGLAFLPDAGFTIDYDGSAIVFSRAGGDEKHIVKALLPELRDEGHTDLVKNSRIRPKKIIVYFTREVEVRFDYNETALAVGSTIAQGVEPLGEQRLMENVLPLPDYDLTVTEISNQKIPQGTYITFDQAFRAWPNLTLVGASRKLDHDLVQRAFIPHMDMWAALQMSGAQPQRGGELYNWVGRIAAVEANYRTTFRINRRFMDRVLSIRAYRVATVDPQSGQRGPSRAWGDYAILYSQRSLWRNYAQNKPLDYALNHSALPENGKLDSNAEPSPATVDIVDADQGIIKINYVGTNPISGDTRTILPSQIQSNGMPTWDARQRERPIAFNVIINSRRAPRLSPSFKLAIIITCVPAAPNDKTQLHKIEVSPSDVRDLLPEAVQVGLAEANGPTMEIRVGPNVEVARIQWSDARSNDIEAIFGLKNGAIVNPPPVANLTGLVLNEGDATSLETGASLNQIAKAMAARVYASMVDRYEGEMTGAMNGGVHLAGYVEEIVHGYGAKGDTTTSVSFAPEVAPIDLKSFLTSDTRMALLHLVEPQ